MLAVVVAVALVGAPTARQQQRLTPVVQVVEDTRAAVVNVSATHVVTESAGVFDFFDFFDAGPRLLGPQARQSVGSGSIIHGSGYVLTNAHVIAQATELTVTTSAGKTLPAHVVAALPEEDVALVKIELPKRETLPSLTLGRSDDVMVGETVIAIGNPVGLGHTVTTGIISAVNRELAPRKDVKIVGLLQTDAAINPGNSGGPLLNVLGEQIGINTAIRGDAQNVGFAIGVDRVRALLPRLLAVENRTLADGARLQLGLVLELRVVGDEEALVVKSVLPQTPAARAKVESGSVVVGVDGGVGAHDGSVVDSLVALYEGEPKSKLTLRLRLPEGSVDVVDLAVDTRPPPDGVALAKAHLGLDLQDLDAATAVRLGLRGGVVVKGVEGPARAAGIQPGDLVVRLGSFGLRTTKELAILEDLDAPNAPADRDVPVRVVRLAKGRVFSAEVVLRAR